MDALRIERDEDVLRVTLARPERETPSTRPLIEELAEAFVDVGKARAVVLAGDGPSFCAGADIEWMRRSATLTHDENVADANALRRMLDAIDTCPAPVIALVQGHALGGGAGLVATADIAIAHERAVFAFSEVKLGIIPAVISPYALRKIGESAARRYFVTGERFDAATALRIGLVHEVTTDLERALAVILDELRTAGPRAARHAKRLVLDRPDGPETARRIAERRTSDEGQEGLRAFLERERPPWAPPPSDDSVTALLALLSAVFIGGADFVGGSPRARPTASGSRRSSRSWGCRSPSPSRSPTARSASAATDVIWSVLAGVAVAVGIGCFYIGMGRGLISVVAPVAAVTGAVIPVVYAPRRGERPGAIALSGSRSRSSRSPSSRSRLRAASRAPVGVDRNVIALALASGLLFGLFYIAFSRVSEDAGLWPVTIERAAAVGRPRRARRSSLTRGPLARRAAAAAGRRS